MIGIDGGNYILCLKDSLLTAQKLGVYADQGIRPQGVVGLVEDASTVANMVRKCCIVQRYQWVF